MSQSEVAKMMGMSKNYISLVENGKREMSDSAIFKFCKMLGIREDWLKYEEGEMKADTSDEDEIDAFCGDVKHLPADDPRRLIMKLLARLSDDDWIAIADIIEKTRDQE